MGDSVGSQARAGQTALLLSTAVAAGLLAVLARRPDVWRGTRLMAWGMMLSAIFQTVVWVLAVGTGGPVHGNATAAAAATLLAVMLGVVVIDFEDHLRSAPGRRDLRRALWWPRCSAASRTWPWVRRRMHPTVGNSSALSAIVALAAVAGPVRAGASWCCGWARPCTMGSRLARGRSPSARSGWTSNRAQLFARRRRRDPRSCARSRCSA